MKKEIIKTLKQLLGAVLITLIIAGVVGFFVLIFWLDKLRFCY